MHILLADDHALHREMTRLLMLRSEPDWTLVMVATLDEALAELGRPRHFDLVLVDLVMPGMSGLDGLAKILALRSGTPVAVLSGMTVETIADAALDLGAAGFLPKGLSGRSLLAAMRGILTGRRYIPSRHHFRSPCADGHPASFL